MCSYNDRSTLTRFQRNAPVWFDLLLLFMSYTHSCVDLLNISFRNNRKQILSCASSCGFMKSDVFEQCLNFTAFPAEALNNLRKYLLMCFIVASSSERPPEPRNVHFFSENLRNIVRWTPGEGSPNDTVYTVEYAMWVISRHTTCWKTQFSRESSTETY